MIQQLTQKEGNLVEPTSWNNKSINDFETFITRIEECKSMVWTSLVCFSCGKIIKSNCAKLSCLSPYCQDEDCIKNRYRIVFAYFKSLKFYSKNLLHTIFGFPHVKKFTREIRENHYRVFRELKKEMKRLGTPLKMVICRDVNGEKGDLFVHYHTGNLPVKDWRKFRQNLYICREKIIKKTDIEFVIKFRHYRNTFKMFKYFANRVSGVFQNMEIEESFGYSKLMDIKEFYETFYNVRKIKLINLRRREAPSVLALMLDNPIEKCPDCGSNDVRLWPTDQIPSCKGPPNPIFKISAENLEKIREAKHL